METHLEEILYLIFIYFTGTKNCLPEICLKYWKLNKSDTWKNRYSTGKNNYSTGNLICRKLFYET
jgi:hypothetical protein